MYSPRSGSFHLKQESSEEQTRKASSVSGLTGQPVSKLQKLPLKKDNSEAITKRPFPESLCGFAKIVCSSDSLLSPNQPPVTRRKEGVSVPEVCREALQLGRELTEGDTKHLEGHKEKLSVIRNFSPPNTNKNLFLLMAESKKW